MRLCEHQRFLNGIPMSQNLHLIFLVSHFCRLSDWLIACLIWFHQHASSYMERSCNGCSWLILPKPNTADRGHEIHTLTAISNSLGWLMGWFGWLLDWLTVWLGQIYPIITVSVMWNSHVNHPCNGHGIGWLWLLLLLLLKIKTGDWLTE